jgi:hypothetical protein
MVVVGVALVVDEELVAVVVVEELEVHKHQLVELELVELGQVGQVGRCQLNLSSVLNRLFDRS